MPKSNRSNYVGGCQEAYDQRQSEIDAANEILNSYNKTRTDLVNRFQKKLGVVLFLLIIQDTFSMKPGII